MPEIAGSVGDSSGANSDAFQLFWGPNAVGMLALYDNGAAWYDFTNPLAPAPLAYYALPGLTPGHSVGVRGGAAGPDGQWVVAHTENGVDNLYGVSLLPQPAALVALNVTVGGLASGAVGALAWDTLGAAVDGALAPTGPTITTITDVPITATAQLSLVLNALDTTTVTAVENPALDAGDPASLTRARMGLAANVYIIQQITHPLDAVTAMTITNRPFAVTA